MKNSNDPIDPIKIRYFLYNAFLIENQDAKIAIDPGQNLGLFSLSSLIPKEEWPQITHILITHGDPDHYWHSDRVARAANVPLILNKSMVKKEGLTTHILGPRSRGLQFIEYAGKVLPLDVKDSITHEGIPIEGIKSVHGNLEIQILGLKKVIVPGPTERAGFGSIGFRFVLSGKTFVNLGDSLLLNDWADLKPDVLMIPIGGLGNNIWTMDVPEALEAVKIISPKLVLPCHYNVPLLFKRKFAPADDKMFKREVERMGFSCRIMKYGDEIEI